ncbi:MAG TPA: hypothetical protein VEB21_17655 [Terriglobales bacterium]|nr:hypothetical protein [Terriglobales bacterium]
MRRLYFTHGQSCPCDDCWNREQRRRKAAQQSTEGDFDDNLGGELERERGVMVRQYGWRPRGGK